MKLCYKEYDVKMSLEAIKRFKQSTGRDLYSVLLSFLTNYVNSKNGGDTELETMRKIYESVDFETASHMFHALVNHGDQKVSLEEMQDAMFRVGWRTADDEDDNDDMMNPWPLVAVSVCTQIDDQFQESVSAKKKAVIKEQSESP